ncbi:MAG: hypothetical protein NO117_05895 [Sulfolobales archaeon]|nr:hypothetical protein [Sulfolobales archaeon]
MSLEALKLALKQDKDTFRRYMVLGAFDGLVVGVSLIVALGTLSNEELVIHSALSGIIGVSAASFWNTVVAESREKAIELRNLERQMLRALKGTIYEKVNNYSVWISALIHALSPLLGMLIVLAYTLSESTTLATALGLAVISALGLMYEGTIKERLKSTAVMTVAGILTALLAYLIRPG